MATCCTQAFRGQLSVLGEGTSNFLDEFEHWKNQGLTGEYDSRLFGKDGAYSRPVVVGKPNALRHVHLVPIADPERLQVWDKQLMRRSRKTSDRALVYVSDSTHGHLLIYILAEPDAHRVASMATPEDANLMRKFAAIAEAFILRGDIVA